MCAYDGDEVDMWHEEVRIARKEHKCFGCGTKILPKQKYFRLFYAHDGYGHTEKGCLVCYADCREFGMAEGHLTPAPSNLYESVAECGEDWAEMRERIERRIEAANRA